MISAASPRSRDGSATANAPGSDYLATEAHYLSLAGRIAAALRGGEGFVLVTGDPPASLHLLAQALRKTAGSHHAVIGISCGPELTGGELDRAGSVVATLPAAGGTTAILEASDPASPLFVFDDVDRLSELQIKEICTAMRHGARRRATGVLLARPGFLARLEEPSLQFLREALAARFRFEEIGKDEGIEFLRHQLAIRHRNEARAIPPGVFRGLSVLGLVLAAGIGGFLLLHYINLVGEPPAGAAVSAPSTPTASAPPMPGKVTGTKAENAATAAEFTPAASTPPPPDEMRQPERPPTAPPSSAPPASAQGSASQHLSREEIAALMTRGNEFLSADDIASARLFYERAAAAGDGAAALRLGATFDPGFLGRAGIRGIPGDPAQASSWYGRARDLGEAAAAERLKSLEPQPLAGPGSPVR